MKPKLITIMLCLQISSFLIASHSNATVDECEKLARSIGMRDLSASDESAVSVMDDKLYISGPINRDTLAQFKGIDIRRIHTVFLSSGGGDVVTGKEIAREIRARGLNTYVDTNSICVSICALMFQAGMKRTMAPKSILGYHSARFGETFLGLAKLAIQTGVIGKGSIEESQKKGHG